MNVDYFCSTNSVLKLIGSSEMALELLRPIPINPKCDFDFSFERTLERIDCIRELLFGASIVGGVSKDGCLFFAQNVIAENAGVETSFILVLTVRNLEGCFFISDSNSRERIISVSMESVYNNIFKSLLNEDSFRAGDTAYRLALPLSRIKSVSHRHLRRHDIV